MCVCVSVCVCVCECVYMCVCECVCDLIYNCTSIWSIIKVDIRINNITVLCICSEK